MSEAGVSRTPSNAGGGVGSGSTTRLVWSNNKDDYELLETIGYGATAMVQAANYKPDNKKVCEKHIFSLDSPFAVLWFQTCSSIHPTNCSFVCASLFIVLSELANYIFLVLSTYRTYRQLN